MREAPLYVRSYYEPRACVVDSYVVILNDVEIVAGRRADSASFPPKITCKTRPSMATETNITNIPRQVPPLLPTSVTY